MATSWWLDTRAKHINNPRGGSVVIRSRRAETEAEERTWHATRDSFARNRRFRATDLTIAVETSSGAHGNARERPRPPQTHNTTPYKIQYVVAAGRHLATTATTSSAPPPWAWLIVTCVRRAVIFLDRNLHPSTLSFFAGTGLRSSIAFGQKIPFLVFDLFEVWSLERFWMEKNFWKIFKEINSLGTAIIISWYSNFLLGDLLEQNVTIMAFCL